MQPETQGLRPPEAFLHRMEGLLGAEYPAFLASYDQPRLGGLRWNPLKRLPDNPSLGAISLAEQIPWEPNGQYYDLTQRPGLHPWHDAGAYYLQEPSAMAPARLLDPQPGQRVLDLCAAPGGKSTQLAALLAGSGLLVANEIVPARAKLLSRNLERMGVANGLVISEHPAALAKRWPGWFHRVLVDAPCSGEGMFRKEPDAVCDWSEAQVAVCAKRQLEILSSAAVMTAPGGRLVYSTCTFAPAENEAVVSRFLQTHPDFSVLAVPAPWFSPGRPDWVADPGPGLAGCFRLWPHRLKGEGHFACVLVRAADAAGSDPPALEPGRDAPAELTAFLAQALGTVQLPAGKLLPFGDVWALAPLETPSLDGLKVLRRGLELGEARKGRFTPAHALALWLPDAAQLADFPATGPEIAQYLSGMTLSGPQTGWTLVCADGLSLGWAKGSNGDLKNHYPKGLRR